MPQKEECYRVEASKETEMDTERCQRNMIDCEYVNCRSLTIREKRRSIRISPRNNTLVDVIVPEIGI